LDATADLGSVFAKYLKSPDAIAGFLHSLKPITDLRINFVAANPGTDRENNTFKQLRSKLESAMSSVVSNTQPQFGDTWEVLAMDVASDQQGTVRLQVVTPRTSLVVSDRAAQDAKGHGD